MSPPRYLYVRSLSNKTEARKWSDKFRARNLCVRVQLRDNDSEVGLISDNSATVRKKRQRIYILKFSVWREMFNDQWKVFMNENLTP